MASVQSLELRIRVQGGAAARVEVDAVAGSVGRLDRAAGRGHRSLGMFGRALGALGAYGAAGGLYKAATSAASFEAQMTRLATQAHVSGREVAQMSEYILKNAPKWATSPQEMALAMYHIESAGFRGRDAMRALEAATKGARVGGANLVDVTNALTGAMVGHLTAAKDANVAMGQLNATVGAGDMTMQQLAKAMGQGTAAVAGTYKLKMLDVGAALATFGDNNIRGADAATKLRQVIFTLAAPSAAAHKALLRLGIVNQLSDDLRKPRGLLVAFQDLKAHMKASGLGATEMGAVLSNAFGRGRTAAGAMLLLDQMDRLKKKYEQVAAGGKKFGGDWQQTTKTFQFLIDQAKAFGQVLLIKVGHVIEGVVRWVIKMVDAFKHNKTTVVAIVAALGGLVAFIGVYKTLIALQGIWDGLMMAMKADPVFLVIAAVVAVGAALYVLYQKVPAVRKALDDIWAFMKVAFKWLEKAAGDAYKWLSTAFKNVWNVVGPIFRWIIGAVKNVINFVSSNWKIITAILLAPFLPLIAIVAFVYKVISDNFTKIVAFLKAVWSVVWPILKLPFVLTWNFLKLWWGMVKLEISTAVSIIKGIWGVLKDVLGAPFSFLWNKVIKPVVGWIVGAIKWMVDHVSKLIGKILGPITKVVGAIGSVVGTATGAVSSAANFVGGLLPSQGGPIRPVYRANGGVPWGSGPRGTDTIPAWLTPGEYVLNRQQVSQVGTGSLESWRAGGSPPGGSQVLEATVNLNVDGVLLARSVQRAALKQRSIA